MIKTSIKLVGYVDILGFSKIIEQYDKGELPNILADLKDAIDPAASFLKESPFYNSNSSFFNWKECLEARLFSDCLCVSAPLTFKTYDFLEQIKFFYKYLMGYQIVLMNKGFYTRGAVTIGSHYSDENMIFSGGLVETYNLETKRAIYPRIILSDNLITEIEKIKLSNAEDIELMLVKDQDGEVFFNHFNYNLLDSKYADKMIEQVIKVLGTPGILDETFLEKDTKNKIKELLIIKNKVDSILEQNLEESIKNKYYWLLDFINFELGLEHNRKYSKI